MSIWERISTVLHEKAKAQRTTVAELVTRLADDESVDPAEVAQTLEAAGVPLEDLRTAVETLKSRRQLQVQIEKEPALRQEQQALEAKLAQLGAEAAEFTRRHRAAVAPLTARLQAIASEKVEVQRARRELCLTASAELQDELTRLEKKAGELAMQRDRAREFLQDDRNGAGHVQARVKKYAGDNQPESAMSLAQARQELAGRAQGILERERSLDELDEQIRARRAEAEAVREKMLAA
jgi:hypothetical protein